MHNHHRTSRSRYAIGLVLGFMAATAVGAAAAWIIFTGLSGQAGGHVGTTSTLGALTFTAEPSDAGHNVTPGTPGEGLYDVQNANPSASETVASISAGTVTTSVPGCASHFTFDPSNMVGRVYAAGFAGTEFGGVWTADASTPTSCADARLMVDVTGTTTP